MMGQNFVFPSQRLQLSNNGSLRRQLRLQEKVGMLTFAIQWVWVSLTLFFNVLGKARLILIQGPS